MSKAYASRRVLIIVPLIILIHVFLLLSFFQHSLDQFLRRAYVQDVNPSDERFGLGCYQARLGGGECAGDICTDGLRGRVPRVAVQPAGQVDGQYLSFRRVDSLNNCVEGGRGSPRAPVPSRASTVQSARVNSSSSSAGSNRRYKS